MHLCYLHGECVSEQWLFVLLIGHFPPVLPEGAGLVLGESELCPAGQEEADLWRKQGSLGVMLPVIDFVCAAMFRTLEVV